MDEGEVPVFVLTGYAECLKMLSVPGASIVDDTKDFEKLLLKIMEEIHARGAILTFGVK